MPKVYSEGETIESIAKPLIPSLHPELATARIEYVYVDKASTKGGRPIFGKVKKLSGILEFLVEADFVIEVALDLWNEASEQERTARVDHLLECCTGEEDEQTGEMIWGVREPDVQEFTSVFRRHGIYHEGLTTFASVAQSIDIEEMIEDVGIETLTASEPALAN